MRGHALPATLIDRLAAQTAFTDQSAWQAHVDRLGFAGPITAPDPVQIAAEGAIWASIGPQLSDQRPAVSLMHGMSALGALAADLGFDPV